MTRSAIRTLLAAALICLLGAGLMLMPVARHARADDTEDLIGEIIEEGAEAAEDVLDEDEDEDEGGASPPAADGDLDAGPVVAVCPEKAYAYVVARGTDYYASDDVPAALKKVLDYHLHEQSKPIADLAFTPDGKHWVLAFEGGAVYSPGLPDDVAEDVDRLRREGRQISTLAFNPSRWKRLHGFVLVHEDGVIAEHVIGRMREKLEDLHDRTAIHDVAFTPDGGWAITSAEGYTTPYLRGRFRKALRRYYGRTDNGPVTAIGFDRWNWDGDEPGWVMATAKGGFTARNMVCAVGEALDNRLGMDGKNRKCYPMPKVKRVKPRLEYDLKPVSTGTGSVELKRLWVLDRQEDNGDDPGILTMAWRGRPGKGGRVWYARGASDIGLVSGFGKNVWGSENPYDVKDGKLRMEFDDLQPWEFYGVMYSIVERDKSDHSKLHDVMEAAAEDIEEEFDREMRKLSAPDEDASDAEKARLVAKMLDVAWGSLGYAEGGVVKKHFDAKLKKKVGGSDMTTESKLYRHFWNASAPGLSAADIRKATNLYAYTPPGTYKRKAAFGIFSEPGRSRVKNNIFGPDTALDFEYQFLVETDFTAD